MEKVFKRNQLLYILIAVYAAIALVLWALFPKGHLVLWFNERYTVVGNFLFKYLTHFGDGLFSLAVCVAFLFIRYYWSWLIFLSYGISSLITQFLKKAVFSDMPRPKSYFGTDIPLNFVDGVEIYSYNSFPSGHTTSAFALACILSLIFPKKWITSILVAFAVLAAISRMYLAQHFVEDTLSGCLIGTITAAWVFYWQEKNSKWKTSSKSILSK